MIQTKVYNHIEILKIRFINKDLKLNRFSNFSKNKFLMIQILRFKC